MQKVDREKTSGKCKEAHSGPGLADETPSATKNTMTEYIQQRYWGEGADGRHQSKDQKKSVEGKNSQPKKQESSPTWMAIGMVT